MPQFRASFDQTYVQSTARASVQTKRGIDGSSPCWRCAKPRGAMPRHTKLRQLERLEGADQPPLAARQPALAIPREAQETQTIWPPPKTRAIRASVHRDEWVTTAPKQLYETTATVGARVSSISNKDSLRSACISDESNLQSPVRITRRSDSREGESPVPHRQTRPKTPSTVRRPRMIRGFVSELY